MSFGTLNEARARLAAGVDMAFGLGFCTDAGPADGLEGKPAAEPSSGSLGSCGDGLDTK
ncbi:hypothetical protein PBS_14900 [Paraburkholderia sp. 2C]